MLILYENSTGGLWSNGLRFPGSEVIAQAGGINALAPLASPGVSLHAERVLRVDPDAVLQVRSLTFGASNPVAGDPRLRTLRAVRTHQVFWTASALNWAASAVETPAYTRSLAEELHPALPPEAGRMLREAYAHTLGVALSDAAIAGTLSITLNDGRGS